MPLLFTGNEGLRSESDIDSPQPAPSSTADAAPPDGKTKLLFTGNEGLRSEASVGDASGYVAAGGKNTYGDWGKDFIAGGHEAGAALASVASVLSPLPEDKRYWQDTAASQRHKQDVTEHTMTPAGRQADEGSFWSSPVQQTIKALPGLAVQAGPAIVAGAATGGLGAPAALAATLAGGAAGGGIYSAGSAVSGFAGDVMNAPEEKLMSKPNYEAKINSGELPIQARKETIEEHSGEVAAKSGVLGAITSAPLGEFGGLPKLFISPLVEYALHGGTGAASMGVQGLIQGQITNKVETELGIADPLTTSQQLSNLASGASAGAQIAVAGHTLGKFIKGKRDVAPAEDDPARDEPVPGVSGASKRSPRDYSKGKEPDTGIPGGPGTGPPPAAPIVDTTHQAATGPVITPPLTPASPPGAAPSGTSPPLVPRATPTSPIPTTVDGQIEAARLRRAPGAAPPVTTVGDQLKAKVAAPPPAAPPPAAPPIVTPRVTNPPAAPVVQPKVAETAVINPEVKPTPAPVAAPPAATTVEELPPQRGEPPPLATPPETLTATPPAAPVPAAKAPKASKAPKPPEPVLQEPDDDLIQKHIEVLDPNHNRQYVLYPNGTKAPDQLPRTGVHGIAKVSDGTVVYQRLGEGKGGQNLSGKTLPGLYDSGNLKEFVESSAGDAGAAPNATKKARGAAPKDDVQKASVDTGPTLPEGSKLVKTNLGGMELHRAPDGTLLAKGRSGINTLTEDEARRYFGEPPKPEPEAPKPEPEAPKPEPVKAEAVTPESKPSPAVEAPRRVLQSQDEESLKNELAQKEATERNLASVAAAEPKLEDEEHLGEGENATTVEGKDTRIRQKDDHTCTQPRPTR